MLSLRISTGRPVLHRELACARRLARQLARAAVNSPAISAPLPGYSEPGDEALLTLVGRGVLPVLPALLELLGGDRVAAAPALLRGGCTLANINPEKLRCNFNFALSQGLTEGEARALLAKVPQIFCSSLEGPAMQAKLAYCQAELHISPREMLLHHCICLSTQLATVDQRVFVMEQRGELQRLAEGEGGKLAWMLDSPLRFCARFGLTLEEFDIALAEHSWQSSRRARHYELADDSPRLEGI